jgi:hypothetical protein
MFLHLDPIIKISSTACFTDLDQGRKMILIKLIVTTFEVRFVFRKHMTRVCKSQIAEKPKNIQNLKI